VKYRIGKISLTIVNKGVDIPGFLSGFYDILSFRVIILYNPVLTGARVRIQTAFTLPENGLHIGIKKWFPKYLPWPHSIAQ
jgi:hypothetical protein